MTEKMKYVNIMGQMEDLDYVIENYISKCEIQLESTLKELPNEKELLPIVLTQMGGTLLKKAEKLYNAVDNPELVDVSAFKDLTFEEAKENIENGSKYLDNISSSFGDLKAQREKYEEMVQTLTKFIDLEFDLGVLKNSRFVSCNFGRMPVSSFKQFEKFLYSDNEVIFLYGKPIDDFIYGVYINPVVFQDKVESIFSSIHFEKIQFDYEIGGKLLIGTPKSALLYLNKKIEEIKERTDKVEIFVATDDEHSHINKPKIVASYRKIKMTESTNEIKKYAGRTSNLFFIFVGWMTEKEADELESRLKKDEKAVLIIEDDHNAIISKPPTKFRNNVFAKPFEMFVKMYGIPSYGEIDPTPFVALTYTIIFGIMFGDVGQGLVLVLAGILLSRKKGNALGGIMRTIGLSSSFFGLVFGSVFGFEFHGLWKSPADPKNINTILLYAVVMGVLLIFVAMSINIINAIRQKKYKKILLDPNGISGFVFYGAVIFTIYNMLNGNIVINPMFILIFAGLPLFLIAFREPILNALNGNKELIESSVGLYLFETVIEVFETLLSYLTNTISFVRVGAFALSHASLMGVVLMLSETAKGSGKYNIVIIILGNILVMALEGLIVGIQVLRIEFYEMFSRFYKGEGREFSPLKDVTAIDGKDL